MLGGYGRGEGGVEVVNGRGRPHNNVDLLLVTHGLSGSSQAKLRHEIQLSLVPLVKKYDIEIDLSIVSALKLRYAPVRLIWYDMRFGHKTIWGDSTFVPSLTRFRIDRIPAWDVRNLLVNRGTLLVVNDYLLGAGTLDESTHKLIVKHAMKAIIGYGDALLFFLGGYHWSYVERQRRMRLRTDIAPEFRRLYDEAADFRFQPDYGPYMARDLSRWMVELRGALMPLHLLCESKRLRVSDLDWNRYPEMALRHAIFDESFSAASWIRKGRGLLEAKRPVKASFAARLGYRASGVRDLLAVVFPVVAYDLGARELRDLAVAALGASSRDIVDLRRAYLRAWGDVGDANFSSVLRKWSLSMNGQGN